MRMNRVIFTPSAVAYQWTTESFEEIVQAVNNVKPNAAVSRVNNDEVRIMVQGNNVIGLKRGDHIVHFMGDLYVMDDQQLMRARGM